ncbi:MAG: hypothetical protein ABSH09_24685 [Bryobacteraceae bacterium]|jgi:hypothetical protein
METSPDDFRRHFSSLSDDALLEINRDDFAEPAKLCYDEEIASRGLNAETASDETVDDSTEPLPELVAVAKFDRQDEANFAQGLLEVNGIQSYLSNDPKFRAKLLPGASGCCLELLVAPEFADDARLVLETPISDDELAAQAESEAEPQ